GGGGGGGGGGEKGEDGVRGGGEGGGRRVFADGRAADRDRDRAQAAGPAGQQRGPYRLGKRGAGHEGADLPRRGPQRVGVQGVDTRRDRPDPLAQLRWLEKRSERPAAHHEAGGYGKAA